MVNIVNERGVEIICLMNYFNSFFSLICCYLIIFVVKNNFIIGENVII